MSVGTTHAATVNELMLGYFLLNERWFSDDAKRKVDEKKKLIKASDFDIQVGRAQVMSKEVMSWSTRNGYKGTVQNVYWTANPASAKLAKSAIGDDDINFDSQHNPSDILAEFVKGRSGRFERFLGVSAKSIIAKKTTFKNPGLGTLDTLLGTNLNRFVEEAEEEVLSKFKLSKIKSQRKLEIRANKKIQAQTQALGLSVQNNIRDALFKKFNSMKTDELVRFFIVNFMNAESGLFPPYIKVTGRGEKEPFTAVIENPLQNDKMTILNTERIRIEKSGDLSMKVVAAGKTVMNIGVKWDTEPLCGSIKLRVE